MFHKKVLTLRGFKILFMFMAFEWLKSVECGLGWLSTRQARLKEGLSILRHGAVALNHSKVFIYVFLL